jgi:hypothetical protein
MRWFLVRFRGDGFGYATPTRRLARHIRDDAKSPHQTVEVIPAAAIRATIADWEAMLPKMKKTLKKGEIAVHMAAIRDLQNRLDSL